MNLRDTHGASGLFVFTFNSSERGLGLMLGLLGRGLPITGHIRKKSPLIDLM